MYWLLPSCSLFSSIDSANARTARLNSIFSNPISEVYLFFYEAALQIFMHVNKFLQREDPIIPVVHGQLITFLKKLLGKFIKPMAIKAVSENNICACDFEDPNTQLSGEL